LGFSGDPISIAILDCHWVESQKAPPTPKNLNLILSLSKLKTYSIVDVLQLLVYIFRKRIINKKNEYVNIANYIANIMKIDKYTDQIIRKLSKNDNFYEHFMEHYDEFSRLEEKEIRAIVKIFFNEFELDMRDWDKVEFFIKIAFIMAQGHLIKRSES
jgi:alpha-L-arabinofuranosidase